VDDGGTVGPYTSGSVDAVDAGCGITLLCRGNHAGGKQHRDPNLFRCLLHSIISGHQMRRGRGGADRRSQDFIGKSPGAGKPFPRG
jgi:hypothetical protein